MFNRKARKTTFIFMGIILITVFFDLFIADRSFSHGSGNEISHNNMTADATKASWFWKK